jgi:hypothetical protein
MGIVSARLSREWTNLGDMGWVDDYGGLWRGVGGLVSANFYEAWFYGNLGRSLDLSAASCYRPSRISPVRIRAFAPFSLPRVLSTPAGDRQAERLARFEVSCDLH